MREMQKFRLYPGDVVRVKQESSFGSNENIKNMIGKEYTIQMINVFRKEGITILTLEDSGYSYSFKEEDIEFVSEGDLTDMDLCIGSLDAIGSMMLSLAASSMLGTAITNLIGGLSVESENGVPEVLH